MPMGRRGMVAGLGGVQAVRTDDAIMVSISSLRFAFFFLLLILDCFVHRLFVPVCPYLMYFPSNSHFPLIAIIRLPSSFLSWSPSLLTLFP